MIGPLIVFALLVIVAAVVFGAAPLARILTGQPRPQAGPRSTTIDFRFLIYDRGEEIEPNVWYQKVSASNKSFVSYSGKWSSDWKWSEEGKVKVAGISHGTGAEDFIHLAQMPYFQMFLEADPRNPVNSRARKVMASAMVNGRSVTKQIGYLPDAVASKYAGVELDIRPASAFLPTDAGLNVGVEVALLVLSARGLKKRQES